jgi:hypothetical protein
LGGCVCEIDVKAVQSTLNMAPAKTRFVYYGESELAKEVTDAIREAGVRLVNKDSTTEGADRN